MLTSGFIELLSRLATISEVVSKHARRTVAKQDGSGNFFGCFGCSALWTTPFDLGVVSLHTFCET